MAAAIPIVDVNRADLPAIARNIEELEDIPFRGVIDPTLCYILSGAEHAYALTQDTLNHYRSDDSKFYKCHIVLDEQALGVRDEDYDRTPGNELYRFNLAATYYIKKSIADQLSIGVVYRIHDSDEPVGPIVSERYFIDVAHAVENAAVGAEKCHIVYPDMIQNIERLNIVAPAAAAAAEALLPVPAGLPAVGLEAVRAEINNIEMLVGPLMGRYYDGEEERFVADHAADGVVYNQIANALPIAIEHLRAAVTPDNMAAAQGELNVLHNLIVNLNREAIRSGPGALPGAVAPPALPLAPIALPNVGDPPGHPPNGLANGGPPDGNAGDLPGALPNAHPVDEFTFAEVTAEVDDLEALQNQLSNIYYEGGAARAAPDAENGRVLYNSINFIVPGVLERLRAVVTPDTEAAAQAQFDRITAIVTFVTNDAAFAGLRIAPRAVNPIALPIAPIIAVAEVPVEGDAEVPADAGEAAAEAPADVEVPAAEAGALLGAPPAEGDAEEPLLNEAPADADEAGALPGAPAEGDVPLALPGAPLAVADAPADAGVAPLPAAPAPQVVPPAAPQAAIPAPRVVPPAAGPFAQLFAARAAAVARPPAPLAAAPRPPAPPVPAPVAAPDVPRPPPAPIGGPPAARPALHPGLDVAAILARVGPRVGARVRPAGLPPI